MAQIRKMPAADCRCRRLVLWTGWRRGLKKRENRTGKNKGKMYGLVAKSRPKSQNKTNKEDVDTIYRMQQHDDSGGKTSGSWLRGPVIE